MVGCSTAYHLAARGLRVVLLEAHALTAGTTWHSASMLWRLRPSYVDVELHERTRQRCFELEQAIEELEGEEAGSRAGSIFSANGGLFVATSRERLAEYERLAEMGCHFYGVDARMVSPAETLDIHPLLSVEDTVGSMYSPGDGTIDTQNVCDAFRRVASIKFGAIFAEGTRVAKVETTSETTFGSPRVRAVVTDSGHTIQTDVVVNACGSWANDIMASFDCRVTPLPLLAMKHAYVVTESIDALRDSPITLPNVRDHELSIYIKAQGDALALGGYEKNPEFKRVTPEFAFSLYDLDWDTFAQNLEGHFVRCPVVEEAGVKSTVCGPESFTPDHKPLLGPSPEVDGLFLACGFNSMGMMLSGGAGEQLAQYVVDGHTDADMFGFDPRRFHANCVRDDAWVKRTTHESYAKTYAIVFPHDEPLAGRLARKSALHDDLASQGCIFQARHGFERPGWFLDGRTEPLPYDYYGAYASDDSAWRLDWRQQQQQPRAKSLGAAAASESQMWRDDTAFEPESGAPYISRNISDAYNETIERELTFGWGGSFATVAAECRAAREGAVVFDQSYFGKFELVGEGAEAAAAYLCAAALRPGIGQTTYTPLCNADGGVEADLTVTRIADGLLYFVAGGSTCSRDAHWIRSHLARFGNVALIDRSDEYSVISVQGPHSRRILAPLVAGAKLGPETLEEPSFDLDSVIPFSTALQDVDVAGVPGVRILRLTFVGELGFELHVPVSGAPSVYRALIARGAVDAGYRAMDSLSAEKGYRHWHADLSNAETPFEAGIGFTVAPRLKRGDSDFLGGASLLRAQKNGVFARKRLVCLALDRDDQDAFSTVPPSDSPLHGAETIWRDDVCVGLVRSAAFSHSLRQTIAYGYVHAHTLPGIKLNPENLKTASWSIGDRFTRRNATFHPKSPFDPTNGRIKAVAY